FLGSARRYGNIGAGLALDFSEDFDEAGVVGPDAQASIVVFDFHLHHGFGGRRVVGHVIDVGLGCGLLLVGDQLDDDRVASVKNLVVLRAVQLHDHPSGGRILAEASDTVSLNV